MTTMRKVIYSIGILALAALSFASCQKQPVPENESGKMVTVTFVAEAPATKSAAVEGNDNVSYNWTDEDATHMKLFIVGDSGLEEITEAVVEKVSNTKLTITATVESGSVVRAMMSNSFTSSFNARLSNLQSPRTDNFDPHNDLLVSEDETITGDMPEEGLVFNRMVVVNKMTLHNLTDGEKINRVVIKSDKHLTGYFNGTSFTGEHKELTLLYEDVAVTGTTFPVYFVTIPNNNQQLTVEVYTDQNTYEKELSATVDLKQNQFTRFGVALPEGSPATSFSDGDYVIANAAGTRIAVRYESGNNLGSLTVVPADDKLLYPTGSTYQNSIFTITKVSNQNLFTIKGNNNLYLYAAGTGDKNHLKGKDTPEDDSYWEIIQNTDGTYSVKATKASTDRNIIRYNSSSDIFSCYGSGQIAIKLYPANALLENSKHTIIVTQPSVGGQISASSTEASYGETITLTATPNTGYKFDAWDVKDESSNAITVSNNTFTMPLSNVTVTASFVVDETSPAGSGTWSDPYNAAKAVQIADQLEDNKTSDDYVYVTGTVTEIIDMNTTQFYNATYMIESGNASIEVYRGKNFNGTNFTATNQLAVNDVVVVYGKLKKYVSGSNTTLEVDQNNYLFARNNEIHLAAPVVEATPNDQDKTIAVSWNAVAGATSYYVTCGTKSETVTTTSHTFTMDDYGTYVVQVTAKGATGSVDGVSESKSVTLTNPNTGTTATITFGTNAVKINSASVTGKDSANNEWTITTAGTTSFTPNTDYCQVGSSKSPATSITFTTTLPKDASDISLEAKFGGFSGTAGTVTLKVGSNSIGTGSLNGTNDVTVSSTSTGAGKIITVTVTGISKGVKCYYIKATYSNN